VFGFLGQEVAVPADVRALADQRAAARKARDWKESDRLRDEIRKLGWIVEDGKDGQSFKRR
jgi:cysteinyl-tRNA synthetase